MTDKDDIFVHLPPRRRRIARDDADELYDEADRGFREVMFYEPEGPMPVRRHRSGAGSSSLPQALVPPQATGTGTVGQTLSCTTGTWTNTPSAYAYQWLRDGANIPAATASTYLLAAADSGHAISCAVTATAAGGAGHATSNAIAVP